MPERKKYSKIRDHGQRLFFSLIAEQRLQGLKRQNDNYEENEKANRKYPSHLDQRCHMRRWKSLPHPTPHWRKAHLDNWDRHP